MAERLPIFEISRSTPQESWIKAMGYFLEDPEYLYLFDKLGKKIDLLTKDPEIKAIQVLADDGNLQICPIIEDSHADTDFQGIFEAGLQPHSLCVLNGANVEDVVSPGSSSAIRTVVLLKFVV